MDLLLEPSEPNEADAVLQAALEFVDAFEGGDANSPQPLLPADAVATKKSEMDTQTYDQRRRQRKKAEREQLQSQLGVYEAQLELLQLQRLPSDRGNCLVNPDRSLWSVVAVEEAEKRREAEELNRRLRALLAELLRSTEGLQLLAANESPLLAVSVGGRLWLKHDEYRFVYTKAGVVCDGEQQIETVLSGLPRQTGRVPSLLFTNRAAITSNLKETMKQVVNSAASVFERFRLEDSTAVNTISCSTRINQQDPITGPCIEVTATTPLACDLNKATAVLWSMLVGLELFGSNHLLSFESRQITSRSAEVGYTFGFGKGNTFMTLDGVSLVEKFETQHGVQLVWTSLLTHPNGQPCLRSRGWILVSSSSNPLVSSVVRVCCRISKGACKAPGYCVTRNRLSVRAHQLRSKNGMERFQQTLLERTEPHSAMQLTQ